MGIPAYSQDNGATWLYIPATTGTDGSITNWRIPFTGTFAPNGSFTLEFQAVIN